jgi:hypothetical protein
MRTVFKQVLFVSLLTSVLVACITDPVPVDPPIDETPIKSAFGTPIGSAFTQTIDATGGTFSEVTTGVTVKAFAGTVDSSAQVKVQPITNTLPDGIGMGVEISSNQPLKKPLIVRFSYSASEPDPNSLRLAVQADDGSWFSLAPVKIDTVNKTVSAALPDSLPVTTKGSSRVKPLGGLDVKRVVEYRAFYMKPKSATVKVGKSVDFAPYARVLEKEICKTEEIPGVDGDLLGSLCTQKKVVKDYPFTNNKAGFVRNWSVNGVVGGDSTNGTIKPNASVGATYTAPANAPTPSTVTVSFESTDTQTNQKLVLVANVTVGGAGYKVIGDFNSKKYPVCLYGVADLTDHVEFVLSENNGNITVKNGSIQNGTMKNENFVGQVPPSSVTQNSPYELTVTAVQAQDLSNQNGGSVGVSQTATVTSSRCTVKFSTGTVNDPAQTLSAALGDFLFDLDRFVNNAQTVTVGDWTYTITRQ